METIGERLKRLRLLKNLTLQEVAETLGTSKGNISNYETNKIKPSADSIIELSKLFNVTTDYILTGDNCINKSSNNFNNYNSMSKDKYSLSEDEIYMINFIRKINNENNLKLDKNESYIISMYRKLNEKNKIKVEGYIEDKIKSQNINENMKQTNVNNNEVYAEEKNSNLIYIDNKFSW